VFEPGEHRVEVANRRGWCARRTGSGSSERRRSGRSSSGAEDRSGVFTPTACPAVRRERRGLRQGHRVV